MLEGQVQNLYLKLARDCYAPGAPFSQSLLHEESLRLLKFSIRDFTQCLQTAVGWRELQQYTDTPEYSSLEGLLLMLVLMLVNGLDNHYISDFRFPEVFVMGSIGMLVVSAGLSFGTNGGYKRALIAVTLAQLVGDGLFLLSFKANFSTLQVISEVLMRAVDARIIVIRYIADTVNTRRQTHWIALCMCCEAVGVAFSFMLRLYAGLLQGVLWLAMLALVVCSFEDVKRGVSPPAKHQGRSMRATYLCVWILFLSNSLAEAFFPLRLFHEITSATWLLFLAISALLLLFSYVTMYVKNRICVLAAFAIGTVSLALESAGLGGYPQWVVLLAMHLTNTISITFLVKKLPLRWAEGFWNSGWLAVLMVQLGEIAMYLVDIALGTKNAESREFVWATTGLGLMTCVIIVATWKTLDFQLAKAKSF